MWHLSADSYRKLKKLEWEVIEKVVVLSEPCLKNDYAFPARYVYGLFAGLMVSTSHLQDLKVFPPCTHLLR